MRQRPLGTPLNNLMSLIQLINDGYLSKEMIKSYMKAFEVNNIFVPAVMNTARSFLVPIFFLTSYKSKFVYEIEKGNETVYFYTESKEEDVKSYLEHYYKGCSYEKLNGWLYNGHWKLLSKGKFGKDRDGKMISGFDWVGINEDIKTVNIKGQSSSIVPIHSIKRALERYGKELTEDDLREIVNLALEKGTKLSVRDKYGRLVSTVKGNKKDGCYRIGYKGTIYDLVLSYTQNDRYRVATFLPKPKDLNRKQAEF